MKNDKKYREKNQTGHRAIPLASLWIAAGFLLSQTGCLTPGTGSTSFSSSASSSSIPPGPKAAKIVFSEISGTTAGSFNPPPSGGIAPGAGSNGVAGPGLQAVQLFNPDNSALTTTPAGGPTDPNWPAWLSYVEIGISGGNNPSATSPFCATFSDAVNGTETTNTNCSFGSGTPSSCGAPLGTFRVSEADCGVEPAANGNGGPGDPIYIRANFNRGNLGSQENIMVVVEYAASSFDSGPASPTTCFNQTTGTGNGATNGFTPENCADFTWKLFMKHNPSEIVQPYMMLVPPTYSFVANNPTNPGSGTVSSTKQFIVPFSGDANLTTLQLSRVGSTLTPANPNFANYLAACDAGNLRGTTGANSPLCAGLVIYSITFYRI